MAMATAIGDSPSGSGRATPSGFRPSQKDEVSALAKRDKNFRRYASGIERVLASFESSLEEWADYISFLSRLLKALQQKPSDVSEIPYKQLLAKRLAQCLTPTLPSGVHQKTIEIYTFVFSTIGPDGLSEDASIYLPGFLPLLSFAALSVKPHVLTIFETYFLKIEPQVLRPALKGVILALLPALEEENSEEFDRTLKILDSLRIISSGQNRRKGSVGGQSPEHYFWQCIFLSCITSPAKRAGALNYLTRYLPRMGQDVATKSVSRHDRSEEDREAAIDAVSSPEPGLLIRCFCAGLSDSQMLTQRGFLDLLISNLPLECAVLQEKASTEDLEMLVAAASSVVLRRDMGLNRRLWVWCLGPDQPPETPKNAHSEAESDLPPAPSKAPNAQSEHFSQFGLAPLVKAIGAMILKSDPDPSERAKPLRICLSLLDRWELGGQVIPRLFLPAMRSVWEYQLSSASQDAKTEVLKSAKMLFDGVESGLLWAELAKLIFLALNDRSEVDDAQKALSLLLFILQRFNIREEEMQTVHIPHIMLYILLKLKTLLSSNDTLASSRASVYKEAIEILNVLADIVPQRAFTSSTTTVQQDGVLSDEDALTRIENLYLGQHGEIENAMPGSTLASIVVDTTIAITAKLLQDRASQISDFGTLATAVSVVFKKTPDTQPQVETLRSALLLDLLQDKQDEDVYDTVSQLIRRVTLLEAIFGTTHTSQWFSQSELRQIVTTIARGIWPALSPSRPKYMVEAARTIWRLHRLSADPMLIASIISSLLISETRSATETIGDIEQAKRFVTLWNLTRTAGQSTRGEGNTIFTLAHLEKPMLLMLDTLQDFKGPVRSFSVTWLSSMSNLSPIINILVDRFADIPFIVRLMELTRRHGDILPKFEIDEDDDIDLAVYYLTTLISVLEQSPDNAWPAFTAMSTPASEDDIAFSLQDKLLGAAITIFRSRKLFPKERDASTSKLNEQFLNLILLVLHSSSPANFVNGDIVEAFLSELVWAVEKNEQAYQPALLNIVTLLLKLRQTMAEAEAESKSNDRRSISKDLLSSTFGLGLTTGKDRTSHELLPTRLPQTLTLGLTSPNARPHLESWIRFLDECLPYFDKDIFRIVLPMSEALCKSVEACLSSLQTTFSVNKNPENDTLETTISLLLSGLQSTLANAHEVMDQEGRAMPLKSPDLQQGGFFGTVVSALAPELSKSRTTAANNRLTVLLCFKDAVKVCYKLWSWAELGKDKDRRDESTTASFNFTSTRLRNRSRRLLEYLMHTEMLESLETLIDIWQGYVRNNNVAGYSDVLSLLNVLDVAKPQPTLAALFNALTARTNPSAVHPDDKSSLTSDLNDIVLAAFLVALMENFDDESLEEIFTECTNFITKSVLVNPMSFRQILPKLIEVIVVLGEKVDHAGTGEQRKMRQTISDLLLRLLTANTTIRPIGSSVELVVSKTENTPLIPLQQDRVPPQLNHLLKADDLITVLARVTNEIPKIVADSDRISSITSIISTQVIAPTIRAKVFPENASQTLLDLLMAHAAIPEAGRAFKKDVADAFSDPKFFSTSPKLAFNGWQVVLRQWILGDKERIQDMMSKIPVPASAGLVFGVGAASARLDADRRAQLVLRRLAFVIISSAYDTYNVYAPEMIDRLSDLLNATTASSPSLITRADVYMVLRALILRVSPLHLSTLWPIIGFELQTVLSSAFPSSSDEKLPPTGLLQACKLLDLLLLHDIDDFQMLEWLFVSDTSDAVYEPGATQSGALVDELATALEANGTLSPMSASAQQPTILETGLSRAGKQRPLLAYTSTSEVTAEDTVKVFVQPFLRQVGIHAFENTFSMAEIDTDISVEDLVLDLFDTSTLAGASGTTS